MNKELQDLAWSVLPKEFKEEVKEYYDNSTALGVTAVLLLENLFGVHNLTSDAEGEKMLYVGRKKVLNLLHSYADELKNEPKGSVNRFSLCARIAQIEELFGSKCLSDELSEVKRDLSENSSEPKPAEPKFKLGDKIRIIKGGVFYGRIGAVTDIDVCGHIVYYKTDRSYEWFKKSDLEPYTEPKEEHRNLSQETANCDKHFDTIVKDSFRNERRLNIAVQFMSAMMSNPAIFHQHLNAEEEDYILYGSLEFADALIAEAEKKGEKA